MVSASRPSRQLARPAGTFPVVLMALVKWKVTNVKKILLLIGLCFAVSAFADPHKVARELGFEAWKAGETSRSVDLWREPAQRGDPESMLFLAFAYRTGQGVPKNTQNAFNWYEKAAQAGVPEAQFELALMHELGLGTGVDAESAAQWYAQATGGEFCPYQLPAGGRLGDK